MFHKDLTDRINGLDMRLSLRIKAIEDEISRLRKTAYFRYYDWRYPDLQEMSASKAIEKILEHLHLTFECEPAKEAECSLVSTIAPKKPKNKPKKKAKKKK